jgi:tetratricopeptide (TPR) repeat protein
MTQKELDKLNDYSKNMYLVRKNEILLKRADARDIPSICLDLLDLYKKLEWFSKEEHLLKQMTGPKWGETLFKENRQALLKRLFQTLVFKAGFNFYNNDFNGADQALKEAQNLGFTDWEAQYLWARTALEQGGYKRALDICSNIESNLKNKTGELASVYNKSRYLTKKIKGYIKYTRNAYDFYEKGYLAYSGKDYKGAVILFEKALNENPDFRQARVWLKRAVKKAR